MCLSVCVCLLVTTVSPIKMRCSSEYGVYSDGPKERVMCEARIHPGEERGNLGASPGPQRISGMCQSYSVGLGGSSDASFRCHYCSNLLMLSQFQKFDH